MEKYKVTVNGSVYEVEVELLSDNQEVKAQSTAPATRSAGGKTVPAPMPGTILAVNVSAGQRVKKGDVLFTLEAMKMENEIVSPADGTIASLSVKKGDAVSTGDVLCSID